MAAGLSLTYILIAGSFIAAAGGLLGSFALLRRMALVGDALSHVALPGIAIALMLNLNILWGSAVFLVVGTFFIWLVENKTKLPVDTVVGVFFALSLAIGALLATEEEILDALFGSIVDLSISDFWIAAILSLAIIIFILNYSKRFALTFISNDLARSTVLKPSILELGFLLIFALAVAVGIKLVGALLMGSVIIIPAAASRNIARSFNSYLFMSALIGVFASIAAILLSINYDLTPGPAFVLVAGALFFISIFFRKN